MNEAHQFGAFFLLFLIAVAKCFLLKIRVKNDIIMAMKKFVIFVMIFTLILATGCVNSSQDLTQNNTPSIDEIIGENTTPETPPIIIPPLDENEEEQKKKYLISTTNSLRIRSDAGDS